MAYKMAWIISEKAQFAYWLKDVINAAANIKTNNKTKKDTWLHLERPFFKKPTFENSKPQTGLINTPQHATVLWCTSQQSDGYSMSQS